MYTVHIYRTLYTGTKSNSLLVISNIFKNGFNSNAPIMLKIMPASTTEIIILKNEDSFLNFKYNMSDNTV